MNEHQEKVTHLPNGPKLHTDHKGRALIFACTPPSAQGPMQAGAIAPASGFSVIERAPGRKAPILVQIEDPPQLFAIFAFGSCGSCAPYAPCGEDSSPMDGESPAQSSEAPRGSKWTPRSGPPYPFSPLVAHARLAGTGTRLLMLFLGEEPGDPGRRRVLERRG